MSWSTGSRHVVDLTGREVEKSNLESQASSNVAEQS
jgi:hypothetical protein